MGKKDDDRDWKKLVHDFHVANMSCRIVDPEIVAQFLDDALCIARGVRFDTHPKILAGSNVFHLGITSFEDQIVVNSLTFRIASKRLVLHNDFDCVIWHCHCGQVQCPSLP